MKTSARVARYCFTCRNKFHVWPAQIRKGNGKFCSHKCANKTTPEISKEKFQKRFFRQGSNECWRWTGPTINSGYGSFCVGKRKRILAHRFAYETWVGPVSPGNFVLHRCDNRLCVNPAHLFQGTHGDNMADMIKKGRQTSGEKDGKAILRNLDVINIRRLHTTGQSHSAIAAMYNVSRGCITSVISGKRWKHIPTFVWR